MARLLRSAYDQLVDFSRTFERESNSAKRSLDSLKRQIEVLEGGDWIGKGADAFYREMNSEVLPAVQRLVKALELASRVTGQIARIFQEVEEECSHFFSRTLSDTGDNAADALRAAGAIAMGGLAGLGAQAGAGLGGAGGGDWLQTGEAGARRQPTRKTRAPQRRRVRVSESRSQPSAPRLAGRASRFSKTLEDDLIGAM